MSIAAATQESISAVDTSLTHFHMSLVVADLQRSVRFYEMLFNRPPTLLHGRYARFELEKPALVLVLYASPRPQGSSLNHVGLRMGTSAELVEIQERLEMAGISTQRQEAVECCYAQQTKFWVSDPDGVLWELYILNHDLDHSGFEDPPLPKVEITAEAQWTHRCATTTPDRIPHDDASLDEVRFEGTFNQPLSPDRRGEILAEARRVLKPGGKIVISGLASGDVPVLGDPKLPGLAAAVRYIPVEREWLQDLERAGFIGMFFEKLGDVNCISVPGVDLRHSILAGYRLAATDAPKSSVLYRGPFTQVRDDQGTVYPRWQRVAVSAGVMERLRHGEVADQFAYFDS